MSHRSGNLGDLSMFDLFRLEVESQVASLNKNLLDLENNPTSPKLLEALMRASHSLKGAARMVGVDPVVQIAHIMEDCFVAAQNNRILITADHADVLLKSTDMIELIANIAESDQSDWFESNKEDLTTLTKNLTGILEGEEPEIRKKSSPKKQAAKTQAEVNETEKSVSKQSNTQNEKLPRLPGSDKQITKTPSSSDDKTLRINADRMSRILGMTSELLVESRTISRFSESLTSIKRRQDELVNVLDLWRVYNEKNGVKTDNGYQHQVAQKLDEARRLLSTHISQLEEFDRRNSNLSSKLYHEVAGSRMQPFSEGAVGFKRMVRDLGREINKDVILRIDGLETPVDRDVLEKIKAPLNHLLRNAVDHGVESMEDRALRNKPQQATIVLSAKHGNGMLRITVKDDGGGIDKERLKEKLLEKNLVDEQMLSELEESELLEFLFLPDFSTRNAVTEISGRGVGLDVVREMVRELGGTVAIETKEAVGTKFTMQLPLTLSVISALLVDIAGEPYAFPLVRVDRILRVSLDQLQSIEGRQYVSCGLDNIGLISGAQILGINGEAINNKDLTVVVISDRLDRYGVVVDKFIGQRQLSVQALDPRLGKIKDVSSAALMEDGSPLFILDVDDLVRSIDHIVKGGRLGDVYQIAEEKIKSKRKRVLVVDDSLTIRGVERDLLESRGYSVEVAVDGMDGWNAVRSSHYDLVITDIDMPRMDGIELVNAIKQDLHLKSIPVMIVSYKDRSEDRRRGLEAGADYYLTKGNFHDETLIEAVVDLIGEATR